EAAAQGSDALVQGPRAKLDAQPTHTGLVDYPQEGLLGRWLPLDRVEEQDQGFVGKELRLYTGDAEWLGIGKGGILRKVSGQRLVDVSDAGIDLGDTLAQHLLGGGIALIRRLGNRRDQ